MAEAHEVVGEGAAGDEECGGQSDLEGAGLIVYEQPERKAEAESDRGDDQQSVEGQEGHEGTLVIGAGGGNGEPRHARYL